MNHDDLFADPTRREFLKKSFLSIGLLFGGGPLVAACGGEDSAPPPPLPSASNFGSLGPLGVADANGVRLPAGFTSRIIATSDEPVGPDGTPWIDNPDGGATYFASDGGFFYAVNSEVIAGGGVSVLRFDRDGQVVDHYPILTKTRNNCSGGKMPWGTWMTCEEVADGGVFECDPTGRREAVEWPALGKFPHEAVAYDPVNHHLYLTEDVSTGRFYRFRPDGLDDGHADFSSGTLEVLRILVGTEGACEWLPIADPAGSPTPTRMQQPTSTEFSGGEGVYYHEGIVYFTTKGDNRIRAYDVAGQSLTIVYDQATHPTGTLSGVDNVIASPFGELVVAEDGGDMEIVAVMPNGSLVSLVQLVGHNGSEVTGIAFDPSYTRLMFGSQRGTNGKGMTFMVEGPFFTFA